MLNYFSYKSASSTGWIDTKSKLKIITFLNLLTCDKTTEYEPHQTGDNVFISLYRKDGIIDKIVISGEYIGYNDVQYKSQDTWWNLLIYMIFN